MNSVPSLVTAAECCRPAAMLVTIKPSRLVIGLGKPSNLFAWPSWPCRFCDTDGGEGEVGGCEKRTRPHTHMSAMQTEVQPARLSVR